MPNMSHCRFENTASDLRDCLEHLDDDNLSEYEQRARKRLIKWCILIARDYEDDPEFGGRA